jgi:hypothetical protein
MDEAGSWLALAEWVALRGRLTDLLDVDAGAAGLSREGRAEDPASERGRVVALLAGGEAQAQQGSGGPGGGDVSAWADAAWSVFPRAPGGLAQPSGGEGAAP